MCVQEAPAAAQRESRSELLLEGSLANAIHYSRLDEVEMGQGGMPTMALL